jgi:hypothetical protein
MRKMSASKYFKRFKKGQTILSTLTGKTKYFIDEVTDKKIVVRRPVTGTTVSVGVKKLENAIAKLKKAGKKGVGTQKIDYTVATETAVITLLGNDVLVDKVNKVYVWQGGK